MATKALKLSDPMRWQLELVRDDAKHWRDKNRKRRNGKLRHHQPEGHHSGGNRTLYALEKRGMVEKAPHPFLTSSFVWTITEKGREALRG